MQVSKWGNNLVIRLPKALDRMAVHNWTLPADYKLDRDEATKR